METKQMDSVQEVSVQEAQAVETPRRVVVPITRTTQREDAVELSLELPGVRTEDVELEHQGRRLRVQARAASWSAPEGMRVLYSEMEQVDFQAGFQLPEGIATEGIQAGLENGVLTLTLPRRGPERRSIPVRGA